MFFLSCQDTNQGLNPQTNQNNNNENLTLLKGSTVVNGWYEEEEIYYIDAGPEEGVTERGKNQIYVIGDTPRKYQAQVVLFVPGEPGYSPHWNVNLVRTAEGKNVQDIIDEGYAAENYHISGGANVLFDDAADIMAAADAGLVTIFKPGVVVLCPVIAEQAADAPGNTELPDDEFLPFPSTF